MSVFDQMKMYWRFAWGLRGFLKDPITLEQSREIIRQRLRNRGHTLLLLVKRAIYENKTSPYSHLLDLVGCEYGDFEKMVKSEGIEPSLKKLAEEGVYISIEEFKGKKEIKRGSKVFKFQERDFDNPLLFGHLEARSGGSRSAGTRTIYDFDHLKDQTTYPRMIIDVYNAFDAPLTVWFPVMPSVGPKIILLYAKAGKIPIRWFSPVKTRSFKPSIRNRVGTNYIVNSSRFSGANLPSPEYVSLDEAWKVTEFMAQMIKKWGSCSLHSYPSLAVRICQMARERGLNLEGAVLFSSGEPITDAKRKEVTSVGATICPIYAFAEAGMVGAGCRDPAVSDDVHLFKDSFALIQHMREVPHAAISVEAFLFSTTLPTAPKILLNVESGDWGVMTKRRCGCKFEEYGFMDHVYNIRGFDKLTGEGMTFIGTDLVKIIEEVLPARFNGSPGDFQMVEEEDEQGHTRMSILVHPRLGAMNEVELTDIVLAELRKGKDTQRMMAQVWAQSEILRVKRIPPFVTATGKLMPLHISKNK